MSEFVPSLAPISLVDHRGGMGVVAGPAPSSRLVVFVPMAFTPVCADEISDLAELVSEAREHTQSGSALETPGVLVVSTDSSAVLRAWLVDLGADALLTGCSDFWPHGSAARAYGAFDEAAGTAMRRSFLVRADGSYRVAASARPGEARVRSDHAAALHLLAEGL